MSTILNKDYPVQYESWLKLKDGRMVFLRPILPTDKHLIVNLFNKLHLDSIYHRFLTHLNDLPVDLLSHLTHIDYNTNFALVALIKEDGKDSIIAVARYGYDSKDCVTDFAITVRDDWQHNGLGNYLLLKILAIGKENGISRFVSIFDPTNNIVKNILKKIGYKMNYFHKDGATQVEVFV